MVCATLEHTPGWVTEKLLYNLATLGVYNLAGNPRCFTNVHSKSFCKEEGGHLIHPPSPSPSPILPGSVPAVLCTSNAIFRGIWQVFTYWQDASTQKPDSFLPLSGTHHISHFQTVLLPYSVQRPTSITQSKEV